LRRDSLLNGLQIVVHEQEKTGAVSLRLRVNGGAMFDLAGKGGLADLSAGMLLRGGGGLDSRSISDITQQYGLAISITVGWDATDIRVSGPADSLETMFDLLGRLVGAPNFEAKELETLKSQRAAVLRTEAGEDDGLMRRKAIESVFGSHPYGRPARGTAESIAKVTRDDLLYYHRRFYLANNSVLIVAGDTKMEQVTRLARAKLGGLRKGDKVPASFRPPEPASGRRVVLIDRPGSSGHALIAQIGFSRRDTDYFASVVMTELLGALNSKRAAALSTSIETSSEPRTLAGPLWVQVKSSAEGLGAAIEAALGAMNDLRTTLPSVDQVELAKSKVVNALAQRLKTEDGVADVVLEIETYGLGRDYLMNFTDRVNAVTPTDVQRAAQAHLKPDSVVIVAIGPIATCEPGLKKLGPITLHRRPDA
jgi:zinc protease